MTADPSFESAASFPPDPEREDKTSFFTVNDTEVSRVTSFVGAARAGLGAARKAASCLAVP